MKVTMGDGCLRSGDLCVLVTSLCNMYKRIGGKPQKANRGKCVEKTV